MELQAILEGFEGITGSLSPRDLTGFGIAMSFLILFRGLSWVIGKRKGNSQLANSILSVLETASPASVGRTDKGYQVGKVEFNDRGYIAVGGQAVKSRLSRSERRQIRRKVAALMTRQVAFENETLAASVMNHAAPALAQAIAPKFTAPAVNDTTLVRNAFNGHKSRTIAGVAKETGLPVQRVTSILNGSSYEYRKNGYYGVRA